MRGVVEPRALTPAQELLRLGVWLSNDDLVISHADDSVISPIYVSQHWGTHYPHHQAGTTPVPRPAARSRDPFARQRRPPEASERLGHSKVGITLDLYSHVIPGMQEDAAAMVDRALSAARDKARK